MFVVLERLLVTCSENLLIKEVNIQPVRHKPKGSRQTNKRKGQDSATRDEFHRLINFPGRPLTFRQRVTQNSESATPMLLNACPPCQLPRLVRHNGPNWHDRARTRPMQHKRAPVTWSSTSNYISTRFCIKFYGLCATWHFHSPCRSSPSLANPILLIQPCRASSKHIASEDE